MRVLNISNRLKNISSHIPKGAYFADIGTDHAYLASYVCLQDKEAKAIASDINEGPILAAKKTIQKYNLEEQIETRLGSGLDTLLETEGLSAIVIAGMGGSLIKDILETGKDKLNSVKRLILQPNLGEYFVREWLMQNGYQIITEEIMEENAKIYEIIVADRTKDISKRLTEIEILFGPFLLRENSPIFKRKWLERKEKLTKTIQEMEKARHVDAGKIYLFRKQLKWIKEVLTNE